MSTLGVHLIRVKPGHKWDFTPKISIQLFLSFKASCEHEYSLYTVHRNDPLATRLCDLKSLSKAWFSLATHAEAQAKRPG